MVPRYFQWVAVAPKMGKRLGGFLSQPGLILGVGSNCSGGREKRQGCVKELRNRIKPKFSAGFVSKVRRLLIAGERVVPKFQTSGHPGLPGNGNSRLLGATGRRGQPISTVNLLKTARNQNRRLKSNKRRFQHNAGESSRVFGPTVLSKSRRFPQW